MGVFSQEEVAIYKNELLNKKESLIKQRQHLVEQDPFSDTERTNENAALDVEAEEQEGHARVEAIEVQVDDSLERINKALARIDTDTFGLCTNCGENIPKGRLSLDPAIEHCLSCHEAEGKANADQ